MFIDATNDEMGSRNGVIDTANRYGLDGCGFDYLREQEIFYSSHSSISAMGSSRLPVNWGLGALTGDNVAYERHNLPPPSI
jgi:hypothetical protein